VNENNFNQQNDLMPQSGKNNNSFNKKGIWLAVAIIVFGIFGYTVYKYFQPAGDEIGSQDQFVVSHDEALTDFEDEEAATGEEIEVPESARDKFQPVIDSALKAIADNKPSKDEYGDLKEDYLTAASSYMILSEYIKAEEFFKKMIGIWPDDYRANLGLADLYTYMHLYEQAALTLAHVVQKYPEDFRVYLKLADLYVNRSILPVETINQKVLRIYDQGVKKANDTKNIYKNYANFLENNMNDLGKALWAEREYNKLIVEEDSTEINRLESMLIEK